MKTLLHKTENPEVMLGKAQEIKAHQEDTGWEFTGKNIRSGKEFEHKNQLNLKSGQKEF